MTINVERLREMRTVTMPNGDRYRFEWIEPSTVFKILDLRDKPVSDKEYLVQSLSFMIEDPTPALGKLTLLTIEELISLIDRYLSLEPIRSRRGPKDKNSLTIKTAAAARQALDQHIDEELEKAEESSKRVMDSVEHIAAQMGGFQDVYKTSSTWKYLDSVSSAGNLLQNYQDHATQIQRAAELISPMIREPLKLPSVKFFDDWISTRTNLVSMYRPIFDITQSVQESVDATLRSLSVIDLPSVIRGWDVALDESIFEGIEEVRQEYRASFLVESNLQFLIDLSDQAITEIVDDALDIPKRQQAAHITRRLFKHTSQPEFIDSILQELNASRRAKNRRAILESVHFAHADRQFLLTIPTLLAQLEGLTVQLLAEMGFVRWDRRKSKWYEADPDTGEYLERVVHKNGKETKKRILLKGLGDLSKFIPKMDNNPLPNTFPHVRDQMPQFRNQVLHGTMTNYGSARRSSMLLLMVQIIGQQLRALEISN